MGKYDDIINLPHHVSKKHPQMPIADRVAQFAPDARKQGGHYNKTTGCVKKIDVINEKLMMIDGNEIAFKHIKEIQGDFFLSIMKSENIT